MAKKGVRKKRRKRTAGGTAAGMAAVFFGIIAVLVLAVVGISCYVKISTKDKIISAKEAAEIEGTDCILVLGCSVRPGGEPSHMLADRIKRGVELYFSGAAPVLLMSGDHELDDYDEVGTMKRVAMEYGVDSSDIFLDHAGLSTYESIYRACRIFGAKKIIIVSQEYHLNRAIYLAESFGMEAYGVSADYREYQDKYKYDIREVFGRAKDVITAIFKPKPTYYGEEISLSGDGNKTNTRNYR